MAKRISEWPTQIISRKKVEKALIQLMASKNQWLGSPNSCKRPLIAREVMSDQPEEKENGLLTLDQCWRKFQTLLHKKSGLLSQSARCVVHMRWLNLPLRGPSNSFFCPTWCLGKTIPRAARTSLVHLPPSEIWQNNYIQLRSHSMTGTLTVLSFLQFVFPRAYRFLWNQYSCGISLSYFEDSDWCAAVKSASKHQNVFLVHLSDFFPFVLACCSSVLLICFPYWYPSNFEERSTRGL